MPATLSITRLRVKPALTSLRRNRCAGSSMSIMYGMPGWSGRMPPVLENSLGIALGVDAPPDSVAAAANPLRSRNTGSLARIQRYASRAPPSA